MVTAIIELYCKIMPLLVLVHATIILSLYIFYVLLSAMCSRCVAPFPFYSCYSSEDVNLYISLQAGEELTNTDFSASNSNSIFANTSVSTKLRGLL